MKNKKILSFILLATSICFLASCGSKVENRDYKQESFEELSKMDISLKEDLSLGHKIEDEKELNSFDLIINGKSLPSFNGYHSITRMVSREYYDDQQRFLSNHKIVMDLDTGNMAYDLVINEYSIDTLSYSLLPNLTLHLETEKKNDEYNVLFDLKMNNYLFVHKKNDEGCFFKSSGELAGYTKENVSYTDKDLSLVRALKESLLPSKWYANAINYGSFTTDSEKSYLYCLGGTRYHLTEVYTKNGLLTYYNDSDRNGRLREEASVEYNTYTMLNRNMSLDNRDYYQIESFSLLDFAKIARFDTYSNIDFFINHFNPTRITE